MSTMFEDPAHRADPTTEPLRNPSRIAVGHLGGTWLPPMAFPKPRALTDALVAPTRPSLPHGALAGLRDRLQRSLAARSRSSAPPPTLLLDDFLLRTSLQDPTKRQAATPFTWSPRTARRLLGAATLRACLAAPGRMPSDAAVAVLGSMSSGERDLGPAMASMARWTASLGPGGRAVVQAEAVTWATQLLGALQWDRLAPHIDVGGEERWAASSGLVLRGRFEVRTMTAPRPDAGSTVSDRDDNVPVAVRRPSVAFLRMLPGRPGPTSTLELGLTALVTTLVRPEELAPARLVAWWPQCGRALVLPIGSRLLDLVADAVAAAWAGYQRGPDADGASGRAA